MNQALNDMYDVFVQKHEKAYDLLWRRHWNEASDALADLSTTIAEPVGRELESFLQQKKLSDYEKRDALKFAKELQERFSFLAMFLRGAGIEDQNKAYRCFKSLHAVKTLHYYLYELK